MLQLTILLYYLNLTISKKKLQNQVFFDHFLKKEPLYESW